MLALVGKHPVLAEYRKEGGKIDRAFVQDPSLRVSIEKCRSEQGVYCLSGEIAAAFDRTLRKTAQGLFYGLYGRVRSLEEFELLSVEHSDYQTPEAVVAKLRKPGIYEIADRPLPPLTQRGAPNIYVVQAVLTDVETGEAQSINHLFYDSRQQAVEWTVYQEETLRFTFFLGHNGDAICVMDLWGTLICAVRSPWPSQRGALRRGRKNPNAR